MPAREHERDQRVSETVEQRKERLCVQTEHDKTSRGAWSKEWEAALLKMRAYSRSRVASETGPFSAVTYETVEETSHKAYKWQTGLPAAVKYVCAQIEKNGHCTNYTS